MAVKQISTFLYVGLAADPKPTDAPTGAKYIASDTGAISICHEGTWIALTGVTGVVVLD